MWKSSLVRAILLGYLLLLAGTAITFFSAFGGLRGNQTQSVCDPYSNVGMGDQTILNRWYIERETRPWLLDTFMDANLTSVLVAWGTVRILERIAPPFQHICPFGFSPGTYTYGLTFLISPFQWLLIGYLLHRLRSRRSSGTS